MQDTQLTPSADFSYPFDGDPFDDDTFFLSEVNCTATIEQRQLEALGLEMMSHPIVVEARRNAMMRFKILGGKHGSRAPEEAFQGIEEKMDEWAFHYLMLALNADANYPKVLGHGYGPPHDWMGMKVLGCRGLGTAENPDNHYCFVPVDVNSRLEIHGKVQDPQIEDVNFWLTSNLSQSMNVSGLNWKDVKVEDDGTFVVTIDRFPADGRPNHLQSSVDTLRLFIRDSRKDWNQRPNAYRVRRLDPPTAPPMSLDEIAALARRHIVDDVATNFWFRQMVGFLDSNTIHGPDNTELIGGMRTQKVLRGRVDLADDEAFVLTLDSGGSEYWVMTLYDWWLMSGDYWSHTSSLNNKQAVANPDGTHTLVFSVKDPGVHNWIDTEGLHHTLFLQRWQMLPPAADGLAGGEPSASCEHVKLADLRRALPEGTKWLTPEERERQLADRLAAFNRRHEV